MKILAKPLMEFLQMSKVCEGQALRMGLRILRTEIMHNHRPLHGRQSSIRSSKADDIMRNIFQDLMEGDFESVAVIS